MSKPENVVPLKADQLSNLTESEQLAAALYEAVMLTEFYQEKIDRLKEAIKAVRDYAKLRGVDVAVLQQIISDRKKWPTQGELFKFEQNVANGRADLSFAEENPRIKKHVMGILKERNRRYESSRTDTPPGMPSEAEAQQG